MAVIRFFILVSFFLVAPGVASSAILLDRVVAVVNNDVITWSELYRLMEYESAQSLQKLDAKEKSKVFTENEAAFLQSLIDMKLQLQEAKSLGITVSPEELEEAIKNIKEKYSMTDEELISSLQKEGLTLEEYRKRLREQMVISQFVNREIRNKIVVSDEKVDRFIGNRGNDSQGKELYHIKQIFFRKPEEGNNKHMIEEKASFVIKKLENGEDFSSLASQYSDDVTRKSGGDLGFVQKDIMAKEFVDVIERMKPGDYSKPFWTDQGLHIILLVEVKKPENDDEIREKAKKQLQEREFNNTYKNYVKSLREKAHIEIRL